MKFPSLARAAGLAAAALLAVSAAGAQSSYPDKPMRIMVGASPGGGTDILARVLADKFSPALKQTVVVENRPGASNTIAANSRPARQPTAPRCCWPPTRRRRWRRTSSSSSTTR